LQRKTRTTAICVMLGVTATCLLIARPTLGAPEADDGLSDEFALLQDDLDSDEVESSSKHRQSIFWSPSAITVFTREDIIASGATTLVDLLRRVPGFDIYEVKPFFPLVGARALTDDSTNLVLLIVDGREALIELIGFPIWAALSFDLLEVERVEVLRGPGSTLYGSNALAGVVSITTMSEEEKVSSDILVSGGEDGGLRLFGMVRGGADLGEGRLSYGVSLGKEEQFSSSDRQTAGLRVFYRSHGRVRYRTGEQLDLSLHYGVVSAEGMMQMYFGDLHCTDVTTFFVMGQAKTHFTDWMRFKAQLYYSHYSAEFHVRNPIYSYGVWVADVPDFHANTPTVDGQLQLDMQALEELLIILGANIRYSHLSAESLLPRELSELRGAALAHLQWTPWKTLQLTAGLRVDLNSETEAAISPRTVVVYRPWQSQSFRLGYSLAFRKPSFVEGRMHFDITSYNPAFPEVVDKLAEQFGNEELGNEKVHSIEFGWRGWFFEDSLRMSLDLFYNFYRDIITFKAVLPYEFGFPDIESSTFQFVAEGTGANAFGGEMEVAWHVSREWSFWLNVGLRSVTAQDSGQELIGEPRLRINAGGRFDSQSGVLIDLALHYVSAYERNLIIPDEPFADPIQTTLGNTAIMIGRLAYRIQAGDRLGLETGFTLRVPLGAEFREHPGLKASAGRLANWQSDFGGQMIMRRVSLYFRAKF